MIAKIYRFLAYLNSETLLLFRDYILEAFEIPLLFHKTHP